MLQETPRFGHVECGATDLVLFPEGFQGLEHLHAWTLLDESPLVWLQSMEDRNVALPLVNPFTYVPDYRLVLTAEDCRKLNLESPEQAVVLVRVSREGSQWSMDFRAPVVVHPALRLGRQVFVEHAQPARQVLPRSVSKTRKIA